MIRLLKVAAVAAAAAIVATGCGVREVDIETSGAEAVPGVNSLYRFCDGPVLIYFTKITGSSDEFDWYYPGGCIKDNTGAWVFNTAPPDWSLPSGDSDDGEG